MNAFRAAHGGRVDRSRPNRFTFDGRTYHGLQGDTLASALLANGVHLVGRSFKYHRPRGILSAGSEEPNALVAVRRDRARYTPNLRATQVEIYEGLEAESQNRWPTLRFDMRALQELLSPITAAGFYYKTFMWPQWAWKALYEPRIRAAAGLGRAPTQPDPDRYSHRFAHCDVLVVGAGPAGLAAALAAARAGARVILCDEQPEFGGSLLSEREVVVDGRSGDDWIAESLRTLAHDSRVTLLARTTAFGYFPHNLLGLSERLTDHIARPAADACRERLWQVRAREVVLATGSIERPLVFPDNDRPGIMLAGAARTYLNRFGVLVGSRAVVITADDAAYRAALELHAAGVEIAAIADTRAAPEGPWPEAARRAGIPVYESSTVLSTRGRVRVSSVELGSRSAAGTMRTAGRIDCDVLLMSGGFTPSVHLFSQSRGALMWSDAVGAFVPGASAERERSAGACRGINALDAVIEDGARAGAAAATGESGEIGQGVHSKTSRTGDCGQAGALPGVQARRHAKAFVDLQNDVTVADVTLAVREGFRSVEHMKRYTTTGMATDQGKTSNLNAYRIVASALQKPVATLGSTTFRMPYTPVTFGSLAGFARGNLFEPERTTPMHDWAKREGAVFENVGLWKRARYFPRQGEDMQAAVARECLTVRNACGIFDASTLGKIEVVGPDALTFMNRLYVNDWTTLAVGRCRYGVLLREDGFVCDDGVVARIGKDRFHVTTTTTGAARVLGIMEDYLQTEWTDLRAWATSTTEQWAVIAVQGPNARKVLAGLVTGIDLAASAMPHMSVAQGHICGIPMRLFRVSFTGELGYEVNVAADYGQAVWEAIVAAGREHGIAPYGTEAMHVLRAEKGYIIVGQETDGTRTPGDVGLAWAIGRKKADFVGKRSLQRPAMNAGDRKQLVGLLALDGSVLEEGAQLIATSAAKPPLHPIGYVSSAYHSAVLGHGIALALLASGRDRLGQIVHVTTAHGPPLPVRVTSPVFYDPEGARLHA